MKKYFILLSIFISLLNSNITQAQENQLGLYPVPAVFISDELKDNNNLLKALSNEGLTDRKYAVDYFINSFKQKFPNTSSDLTERNKYRTLAAYINIPRASEYNYIKGENLADIYLPLTMSINIANMATSEILYSYPYTFYSTYGTTKDKLSDQASLEEPIISLYKDNYNKLVDILLDKASTEFKPFAINASVIDTYKDSYVLNKGLTDGIAKGDCLTDQNSNQISVIYSDIGYSIAQNILGSPVKDSIFTKFSNTGINDIKKPKIAFVNDLNDDKLYQFFSTAIGSTADFALISLDKNFYQMQNSLTNISNLNKDTINKREVPDYFLKIKLIGPVYGNYPSTKDYFSLDKYSLTTCGSVFNKAGQVIYGKCVSDSITDEVVSNMRFENEARKEVLIKNALIKLATDFSQNIKFKQTELSIDSADKGKGYYYVKDLYNVLNVGNNVTAYKKIKTDSVGKEINIPVYQLNVTDKTADNIVLSSLYPYSDKFPLPEKGDKILMNSVVNSTGNSKILNFSPHDSALAGTDLSIHNFDDIAFYSIASNIKYPFTDFNHFKADLENLNSGNYGFKRKINVPATVNSDYTVRPVYKIIKISEEVKNNMLEQKYNIIIGIIAYKGEEIITKKALQQESTIFVPVENNTEIINDELVRAIYPLLEQVTGQLNGCI